MDRCLVMFIAGVGISVYAENAMDIYWLMATLGFACLTLWAKLSPQWPAVSIVCVFCGIAVTTANLNWQAQQQQRLESLTATSTVTVQIIDEPIHYPSHSRFNATLLAIDKQSLAIWQRPNLRLSWYGQAPEPLQLGQQWQLNVSLKMPRNYWNQGAQDFVMRMRRQGIVALGSVKAGWKIAPSDNPRARLLQRFASDSDTSMAVLAALSIGSRTLLSKAQYQQWQQNGLAHALAISGLHLSLVAWAALNLSQRMVRRAISWRGTSALLERVNVRWVGMSCALIIAIGYAALAGFSIATVRALLMLTVVTVHYGLAIRASHWRVLLRAVAVLLLVDPLAWLDNGFWLSVIALLTIFLTLWRWQQMRHATAWRSLMRLQLMFLIAMAPLSLLWFGGVSLWAPATNVLVLPIISGWVLPLNLLATAAELAYAHHFADNLWFLAGLPLQWLTPVLQWTAAHESNWWQPAEAIPNGILLGLLALVIWPVKRRVGKSVLILVIPIACAALYWSRARSTDLLVHVLDVGQAQAIVLERQGRAVLVDTGNSYASGYSLAAAVIRPFLQNRELQLDAIWISHNDRDHSGGLDYLRRHYPKVPRYGAGTSRPCQQGMAGYWNQLSWQVLWPQTERLRGDNDQSCVLWFRYNDFSLLLPGDIEFAAERRIAEGVGFPSVDVMVAPHHGSRTSSGWLMLKQVQPSLILLSNGQHKGYNFPHRYTVERYQQLQRAWYNTKDWGQLTVRSDGRQWRLVLPMASKRQRQLYQLDD